MLAIKNVKEFGNGGKTFTVTTSAGIDILNCRLATKKDGTQFASGPSMKKKDDTWLNLVYFPEAVSRQIVALVNGGNNQDAGYPTEQDYQQQNQQNTFDDTSEFPF